MSEAPASQQGKIGLAKNLADRQSSSTSSNPELAALDYEVMRDGFLAVLDELEERNAKADNQLIGVAMALQASIGLLLHFKAPKHPGACDPTTAALMIVTGLEPVVDSPQLTSLIRSFGAPQRNEQSSQSTPTETPENQAQSRQS